MKYTVIWSPAAEAEVPDKRGVHVGNPRTDDRVPVRVSKRPRRLYDVRVRVEPPRDRLLIAGQIRVRSRCVGSILAPRCVRPVGARVHRQRESARLGEDRADLPVAEDRAAESGPQERLAVPERQLVEN